MMRRAQAVVMARWSPTCEYAALTPSGFGPSARTSAPRINRSRSSPGWVLGPALTVNLHRCRAFVDPRAVHRVARRLGVSTFSAKAAVRCGYRPDVGAWRTRHHRNDRHEHPGSRAPRKTNRGPRSTGEA